MNPFQQVIFHFYDFNQVSLKLKYTFIAHSYSGWNSGIPLSIIPVLLIVCIDFNDCQSNNVIYYL